MVYLEIHNAVKVDFLYVEEPNVMITIFYISGNMALFQLSPEIEKY